MVVHWVGAEMAVTIVAASIPVLRVLVREVKGSSRGYHNAWLSNDRASKNYANGLGGHSTTITTRRSKARRGSTGNNQSDESILGEVPGRDIVLVEHQVEVNYSKENVSASAGTPNS